MILVSCIHRSYIQITKVKAKPVLRKNQEPVKILNLKDPAPIELPAARHPLSNKFYLISVT